MFNLFGHLFQTEHQYVQENMSAYLDEELGAGEKTRIEQHLAKCSRCRADLATLRQTVALLHLVPEVPLPRSFLVPASEARPQPVLRRAPAYSLLRSASAIATVLFVIVLSGNLLLPRGPGIEEVSDQAFAPKATPLAAPLAEGEPEKAMPLKETVRSLDQQAAPAATKGLEVMAKVAPRGIPEGTVTASPVALGETPAKAFGSMRATVSITPTLLAREAAPVAAVATQPPLPAPTSTPVLAASERAQEEPTRAPAFVAEPPRSEPGVVMGLEQARARQLVREILNGAMWALLLTTVALWTVTAILSKQRR